MTRLFCAHSPMGVTEVCECGSAYRCPLYPEEAARMREEDELSALLVYLKRQPKERLAEALRRYAKECER